MWGCPSVLPCVPRQKVARGICLALSTMSTFAVIICIMTKVMTSGDGGADHPIAGGGDAGEGGGDGGSANQDFDTKTNSQIALFNIHIGEIDTRITLAMGLAGTALAVGILLCACNSSVCVRQGWSVWPKRAARLLRQQDLEASVQSQLLDHHHRLQLITNPRPYQSPARFISQGMQRAEVMD